MLRNHCVFRGNLTRDPEMRRTQSGKAVVNFSIAVNGYKKDDVEYIDLEAWDQRAEFIAGNVSKGDQVEVAGRHRTDNYTDKEGNKRRAVKYVVEEIDAVRLKKWDRPESANHEGDGDDVSDDAADDENIKF